MNLLVPDNWLREFLKTEASPSQIKEYLSLCGPSVERAHTINSETVYDIEITTNRPDAMSIVGIAREAAVILPRFGIPTIFLHNPYAEKVKLFRPNKFSRKLTITTDPLLNPRWTSIVINNVSVKPSPNWLKKKLEFSGIRSLNNVIDVTNFLMRTYGQPAHAFDFDLVEDKHNHVTMKLRASKKGEQIVTLDGKSHVLAGGDIVIEDGKGRLIDLCGIMGAQNSAIKENTKTVILFLQTYAPMNIRRTMMSLAHRTEAGSLFEKGTDPEIVLPVFAKGIELISKLSGGQIASQLYDFYPKPFVPYQVTVSRSKLNKYLGKFLTDIEITNILISLGFQTKISWEMITVIVPSFRRDVTIDVDIIEELARIYGYHTITPSLPDTAPPVVMPDPALDWEGEVKIRLRDWGYTETYTYSMISEELMDIFKFDKSKAYRIANPLSEEWEFMRPHLLPSMLRTIAQNIKIRKHLSFFELSMSYLFRTDDLPLESPMLIVVWTGEKFYEAKGLAQALFQLFGINFPKFVVPDSNRQEIKIYNQKQLTLGKFGSLGIVNPSLLSKIGITVPMTQLYLDFTLLVKNTDATKRYVTVPKYPPIIEDLTFIFPQKTYLGSVTEFIKQISPRIFQVDLTAKFENSATFNIQYQAHDCSLTNKDAEVLRNKVISEVEVKFQANLKGIQPI